jgi:hypothetical protein
MRRRDFMLGAAAVAWPLSARAQQAGMPVVTILYAGSLAGRQQSTEAFRKGLQEVGLALLWQIYSRRCSLQINFRQCGHRCGGSRAMNSRMAWRTAGKVG